MKACPRCGNPVEHSCYHDGHDVQSVEMDKVKIISMLQDGIEYLEGEIEDKKNSIMYVKTGRYDSVWGEKDAD